MASFSNLFLWKIAVAMNNPQSLTENGQAEKVDQLHIALKLWQSNLGFMQDELIFIDHLLKSYVFQPNTPNLFERIQDYLYRLKKAKKEQKMLVVQIGKHENVLAGMLECTDDNSDLSYYQKHDALKAQVMGCTQYFQQLKSEIFNYAIGVLKKRKPNP